MVDVAAGRWRVRNARWNSFLPAWPRKQPERDFVARKWELNLLATMAKTKRWGNQLGIGLLAMLTHHYRFVLPAGSGAKVSPRAPHCMHCQIESWTPLSWLVGAALSRSGPSLYSVAARVQVEKRVVASASGPLDQNRAQRVNRNGTGGSAGCAFAAAGVQEPGRVVEARERQVGAGAVSWPLFYLYVRGLRECIFVTATSCPLRPG